MTEEAVARLADLYARRGANSYVGEPVTQLEHAAQAAELARGEGYDDEVVCAAFLHDVGHLCGDDGHGERMGRWGVAHHERVGADYLSRMGFSDRVVALVARHVDAKRYLTRTRPDYYEQLSEASKQTLKFQGGPMSAAEAAEFEADPLFDLILKLREWDEAAKVTGGAPATLEGYARLFAAHLGRRESDLSDVQLAFWRRQGYLKIDADLDADERAALSDWTEDLRARPETPGKWMKYYERGPKGERLLSRIEDFVPYHEPFNALLTGPRMLARVSALLGEPGVLFKEKINYKLSGGAGYAAHQDAPAFTSFDQSLHITLMISVDATTPDNGCLEVAKHPGDRVLLPLAEDLTIDAEVARELAWSAITTRPGDLLFFDSFLPHRSGPNRSSEPRRALYVTYNKASEGNVRDRYFREKRAVFPPEIEREPGRVYGRTGVFNVGNPIE